MKLSGSLIESSLIPLFFDLPHPNRSAFQIGQGDWGLTGDFSDNWRNIPSSTRLGLYGLSDATKIQYQLQVCQNPETYRAMAHF